MIKISNKALCCGCSACAQICPNNCISMESDNEGFKYPIVDNSKCIKCNLCDAVCPIINKQNNDNLNSTTYVAFNNDDEIRQKSSSGGIFTSLAEMILSQGGVVFGAAFDTNMIVSHIAVDDSSELYRLRGSKYMESNIDNTYILAKDKLEEGKKVLFSGTPCQIAGLKKYLKKDYSNLLLVDILCHGVPSPKLWKKYVEYQKNDKNSNLIDASFRKKNSSWKRYNIGLLFSDMTSYECVFTEDKYMRFFLSNICLRPSCYNCRFKNFLRVSDITIGDAWGIEKIMPEMYDDKGTSIVVCNTDKGIAYLNCILDNLTIKLAQLDLVLPPTADSRVSVKPHPKRERFFKLLSADADIDGLYNLLKVPLTRRIRVILGKIKRKVIKVISGR